ncbi:hypothetical protein ACJX0J_015024, partial [Zea mays]
FMTDEDVAVFNGMKEMLLKNNDNIYDTLDLIYMHFSVGLFIGLFVDLFLYYQALDFRLWSTFLLCYTCGPKSKFFYAARKYYHFIIKHILQLLWRLIFFLVMYASIAHVFYNLGHFALL